MTTVFFDRTLGKKAPSALKEQELPVEMHRDHFPHDALDADWLPEVSRRGWVVVTNDKRIRYNVPERQAVEANRVGLFVLASGQRTWEQYVITLTAAWERIQRVAETEDRPYIYAIHVDGRLRRLYPLG